MIMLTTNSLSIALIATGFKVTCFKTTEAQEAKRTAIQTNWNESRRHVKSKSFKNAPSVRVGRMGYAVATLNATSATGFVWMPRVARGPMIFSVGGARSSSDRRMRAHATSKTFTIRFSYGSSSKGGKDGKDSGEFHLCKRRGRAKDKKEKMKTYVP